MQGMTYFPATAGRLRQRQLDSNTRVLKTLLRALKQRLIAASFIFISMGLPDWIDGFL